jgi:hypothetical protein
MRIWRAAAGEVARPEDDDAARALYASLGFVAGPELYLRKRL